MGGKRLRRDSQKPFRSSTYNTKTNNISIISKLPSHHARITIEQHNRLGLAVTRSSLRRDVRGSIPMPVKSDRVLQTARHRFKISSKGAVLPRHIDTEMGPANSLHHLE